MVFLINPFLLNLYELVREPTSARSFNRSAVLVGALGSTDCWRLSTIGLRLSISRYTKKFPSILDGLHKRPSVQRLIPLDARQGGKLKKKHQKSQMRGENPFAQIKNINNKQKTYQILSRRK
jgi:hypothetical protein